MPASRIATARLAWITLAWNLIVILWGAVVRATGSGAGCGDHWPLCDGEIIPPSPGTATLIEFGHRITSTLAGILVIAVVWAAFRAFPKGSRVRKAAVASLILVIFEGLIGAALVKFELVESNDSLLRAVAMGGHLINTLLLLAALTYTAWWCRSREPEASALPLLQKFRDGLVTLCVVAIFATCITGAISALGDTLFPASSLVEGLEQDLDPSSHILLRLRIFHPLIAVGAALALLVLARRELENTGRTPASTRLAQALMALALIQTGGGVLNIALLAPVWMQLVHLLLADLTWIAFLLLVDERPSS